MSGLEYLMDDISYGLEEFSHEMRSSLGQIDLASVATVLLGILLIIIVYDIISYLYLTTITNNGRSFSPTFLSLASKAWEYRNELGINPAKYISARTLEALSPVLYAIESAIEKYEHNN